MSLMKILGVPNGHRLSHPLFVNLGKQISLRNYTKWIARLRSLSGRKYSSSPQIGRWAAISSNAIATRSASGACGHHMSNLCQEPQDQKSSYLPGGHIPVMLEEVISIINPRRGQKILDMTYGGGGHSLKLIQKNPCIDVYALDRDSEVHKAALKTSVNCSQLHPLHGKFSEVHKLLAAENLGSASMDAVLFDAGASSMQFDQSERGFSLSQQGPLDMRMDQTNSLGASDVINHLSEEEIFGIIKKYGEEKMARPIARAIIDSRFSFGTIRNTSQLANIIASVFQSDHKHDKQMRHSHVGTKSFQALRIFVNDELNELNNGLKIANRLLKPGGVCVAITFHSLEDRIVKCHFHGIAMDDREMENILISQCSRDSSSILGKEDMNRFLNCKWKPLTKKVIQPSQREITENPRSRSSRLRAAMKL